jgi:hypothetical protein
LDDLMRGIRFLHVLDLTFEIVSLFGGTNPTIADALAWLLSNPVASMSTGELSGVNDTTV